MSKEIFVATGGTDRTTVVAKAAQRTVMVSQDMLPCLVSPVYDGKTILVVVKKGKVAGAFNRLGQAYPLKDKQATNGFAPMGALLKGFFDVDGVYQAQVTANTVSRAKIKAILSTARSTPLTAPEKLLVEGTLLVLLTDYYTLEEFNGDLKKASPLVKRLSRMKDIVLQSSVTKAFPQFACGDLSVAHTMDDVAEQLKKGSLLVRESTELDKMEVTEPSEQEKPDTKADKKGKKTKKGKKVEVIEEPVAEEPKPKEGKKAKKVKEPVAEPIKKGKKKKSKK